MILFVQLTDFNRDRGARPAVELSVMQGFKPKPLYRFIEHHWLFYLYITDTLLTTKLNY